MSRLIAAVLSEQLHSFCSDAGVTTPSPSSLLLNLILLSVKRFCREAFFRLFSWGRRAGGGGGGKFFRLHVFWRVLDRALSYHLAQLYLRLPYHLHSICRCTFILTWFRIDIILIVHNSNFDDSHFLPIIDNFVKCLNSLLLRINFIFLHTFVLSSILSIPYVAKIAEVKTTAITLEGYSMPLKYFIEKSYPDVCALASYAYSYTSN